ncbi:hypothetical protein AB4084_40380, partial [Lysobacter sp. 2RAB21]
VSGTAKPTCIFRIAASPLIPSQSHFFVFEVVQHGSAETGVISRKNATSGIPGMATASAVVDCERRLDLFPDAPLAQSVPDAA